VTREVFVVAWSKRSGVDGVDLLAELLRAGLVEVRDRQITPTSGRNRVARPPGYLELLGHVSQGRARGNDRRLRGRE
jgi:hypothetical protein